MLPVSTAATRDTPREVLNRGRASTTRSIELLRQFSTTIGNGRAQEASRSHCRGAASLDPRSARGRAHRLARAEPDDGPAVALCRLSLGFGVDRGRGRQLEAGTRRKIRPSNAQGAGTLHERLEGVLAEGWALGRIGHHHSSFAEQGDRGFFRYLQPDGQSSWHGAELIEYLPCLDPIERHRTTQLRQRPEPADRLRLYRGEYPGLDRPSPPLQELALRLLPAHLTTFLSQPCRSDLAVGHTQKSAPPVVAEFETARFEAADQEFDPDQLGGKRRQGVARGRKRNALSRSRYRLCAEYLREVQKPGATVRNLTCRNRRLPFPIGAKGQSCHRSRGNGYARPTAIHGRLRYHRVRGIALDEHGDRRR